jgi:hypothetical protein
MGNLSLGRKSPGGAVSGHPNPARAGEG